MRTVLALLIAMLATFAIVTPEVAADPLNPCTPNRSTDTLVLATVDQAGKPVTLKTVSLGAAIAENVWYRVSMDVAITGSVVSVTGTVFRHQTPTDPNSALTTQVGMPLTFSATLEAGALVGVDATGEVGILAAAVNAAISSSVTNITIER